DASRVHLRRSDPSAGAAGSRAADSDPRRDETWRTSADPCLRNRQDAGDPLPLAPPGARRAHSQGTPVRRQPDGHGRDAALPQASRGPVGRRALAARPQRAPAPSRAPAVRSRRRGIGQAARAGRLLRVHRPWGAPGDRSAARSPFREGLARRGATARSGSAAVTPFAEALRSRTLLLDAAMGTALIDRGLRGRAPEWNLTRPTDVLAVHRSHIEAGAQLVLTNTFVGASAEEAAAA